MQAQQNTLASPGYPARIALIDSKCLSICKRYGLRKLNELLLR